MPSIGTKQIIDLVRFFGLAISLTNRTRHSIFDSLVSKRFDEFRAIHTELHSLLFPIERELAELEREIRRSGNRTTDKLANLSTTLETTLASRRRGQVSRQELYVYCLEFSRSTAYKSRNIAHPFSADERQMLTVFMGSLCKYFEQSGRYEHDFGSTLGALINTIDYWTENGTVGAEDVAGARRALGALLQRMTDSWLQVVSTFGRLEQAVKAGVRTPNRHHVLLQPPTISVESMNGRLNDKRYG
ncbi:MAG: hypothetical protein Q7T19_02760 [Caulobacter sp.]|nr:hypothetical protein [Caulobacter sp.]